MIIQHSVRITCHAFTLTYIEMSQIETEQNFKNNNQRLHFNFSKFDVNNYILFSSYF